MSLPALITIAIVTGCLWAPSLARHAVVMGPYIIRPGGQLELSVLALNTSEIMNFHLKETDSDKNIAANTALFQKGVPKQISLNVPAGTAPGRYTLAVEGTDSGFKGNTSVMVTDSTSFIMIQTDKGIYKPGSKVRFRAMALTPDLHLLSDNLNITVKDPASNTIFMWNNVGLDSHQNFRGITSQEFQLADQPMLGEWTIRATASGNGVVSSMRAFKVDEYVLPRFEVMVEAPQGIDVTSGSGKFTFKVKARYTYGKPVMGTAVVSVPPQPPLEMTLNADGEAEFSYIAEAPVFYDTFGPNRYWGWFPSITITANVTEKMTNRHEAGQATVKLNSFKYQLTCEDSDKTYVPGLNYTYRIKVRDSATLLPVSAQQRAELYLAVTLNMQSRQITQQVELSESGDITGEFTTPAEEPDSSYPYLQVSLYNKTQGKTAVAQTSVSSSPLVTTDWEGLKLKLANENNKVKAGDVVPFKVFSKVAMATYYSMYAQGLLIQSGTVSGDGTGVMGGTFSLTAPAAPSAVVIVYAVTASGQLIMDYIKLTISGFPRQQVTAEFNATQVSTGSAVNLKIKGDNSAFVGVVAVDKSSLLLEEANDIDVAGVLRETAIFEMTRNQVTRRKRAIVESNYYGTSTSTLIEDSGIVVITDADITRSITGGNGGCANCRDEFEDMVADAEVMMAPSGVVNKELSESVDLGGGASVRKNFPETWIWVDSVLGADGQLDQTMTIPDSITSWVLSAFTVSNNMGLDIPAAKTEITAFNKFFIRIDLPYSMNKGESCQLKIYVFNYNDAEITADITLLASDDFKVWPLDAGKAELEDDSKATRSQVQSTGVKVPVNEAASMTVWILPQTLGLIDVNVMAKSSRNDEDYITKKLLIEPPGETLRGSVAKMVDTTSSSNQEFALDYALPQDVVEGSLQVKVQATGDIMGTPLSNLDSLVQMPTGCGEQNMVTLVPNIYALKYDNAVPGTMEPAKRTKALGYIQRGYQRELNYKHSNWSYSAFGEGGGCGCMRSSSSVTPGSTWLTAFVMQSFAKASEFINVDEDVMTNGVSFLMDMFNATRRTYVAEYGQVIHKEMQSGTASRMGLTIYTFLSLYEVKSAGFSLTPSEETTMSALKTILENYYTNNRVSMSTFELSMLSYAFALSSSSLASQVINDVIGRSTVSDDKRCWTGDSPAPTDPPRDDWHWLPRKPDPSAVEIPSYVLLALTHNGDYSRGLPVYKCLSEKMSDTGSFSSTQDTVVGLSAISQFSVLVSQKMTSYNLNIAVTYADAAGNNVSLDTISITEGNKQLLQTLKVPAPGSPTKVYFKVSGSGLTRVVLAWQFNVMPSEKSLDNCLKMQTSVSSDDSSLYEVTIDLWCEGGQGEMAILTVDPVSGFSPDLDSIRASSNASMVEVKGPKESVVYYFDTLNGHSQTVKFQAVRTSNVADPLNPVIKAEMYYSPDIQTSTAYEPPSMVKLSKCQLSGNLASACPILTSPQDPNAASQIMASFVSVSLLVAVVMLVNRV